VRLFTGPLAFNGSCSSIEEEMEVQQNFCVVSRSPSRRRLGSFRNTAGLFEWPAHAPCRACRLFRAIASNTFSRRRCAARKLHLLCRPQSLNLGSETRQGWERAPMLGRMDRSRTAFTLVEAAWLLQQPEDTLYRRCRRGAVRGACQIGRTWIIPVATLRPRLSRLAAELATALACDEISVVRSAARSDVPAPLAVYRWVSDSGALPHSPPEGDAQACER
jgi:hypothetical protein